MALFGTSMSMVQVPDWQVLAEDLNVRTGLSWTICDDAGLSTPTNPMLDGACFQLQHLDIRTHVRIPI